MKEWRFTPILKKDKILNQTVERSPYGAIVTTKFNYMENKKSKGLGDTIEKITKATGIKKVVEKISKVTGKDCGCAKRKDDLNKIFPYNYNK